MTIEDLGGSIAGDRPTVIVLVGPKGAGKTFVGSTLERHLPLAFVRVEPIFLALYEQDPSTPDDSYEGYARVETVLKEVLSSQPVVCIETTGAAPVFERFLDSLHRSYRLLLIKVTASPDVCVARVRSRDQAVHIAVSDRRLDEINERARRVTLPWALVLENDVPLSVKGIVERVGALISAPA